MPGEPIRRHVLVTGRVQGVFFRASTRDEARRQGVTGWVRNNPGGTVEAEVQGPPERVEAVVDFCRQGPRFARVTSCDVQEIPVETTESDFEIR
ncbi:acylphosphatase [Euzebya tangerina]|uniref:acylphosphatase n=1 Tax=Euzebya tangerina TaxID=591198 RepID=UPI00196A8393|nr:acylphosphatase [Euzebya tangerina]